MDIIEQLNADFLFLAKLAILTFLGIYTIFSIVIVKQAKLMAETLDVELDRIIVAVSYMHLLVAIVVFMVSILFL